LQTFLVALGRLFAICTGVFYGSNTPESNTTINNTSGVNNEEDKSVFESRPRNMVFFSKKIF
jgi:hypothetical protein